MITKLSTYRVKMVFISMLLTGVLASIHSCQHEFIPANAAVSSGTMTSVTKYLIKYTEKCLADVSPFCYLVFIKTKLGKNYD